MKKKNLISIILIIIIILVVILIKNKFNEQKYSENNVISNDESKTVEDIKMETGATADEDIYEIQTEYDGREILAIKPDIQFATVLAGILKKGQPSEKDIEKLDLSQFHKGVWISESSRNKFLKILEKCEVENFAIDDEGYLYKKEETSNDYSSRLDNLINSDILTIIDITGTCYIRDDMTGDIVEYPFKDMDLYQICENFEAAGSKIIIITTNDVEEADILEAIVWQTPYFIQMS